MNLRKRASVLFMIIFITANFSSCNGQANEINVQNVMIENIGVTLNSNQKSIKIIDSHSDFLSLGNNYKINEEILNLYDDVFFENSSIIFIAIGTTPEPTYSVSKILKQEENMTIFLDEKRSHLQDALLVNLGFFIEVSKEDVSGVEKTAIEITTIFTD